MTSVPISLMRLSNFLENVVAKRRLPEKTETDKGGPMVVMKMDIETSELEVLPDIIFSGTLRHIDTLMIEYHMYRMEAEPNKRKALNHIKGALQHLSDYSEAMEKEGGQFKFVHSLVDDESYNAQTDKPLPRCG